MLCRCHLHGSEASILPLCAIVAAAADGSGQDCSVHFSDGLAAAVWWCGQPLHGGGTTHNPAPLEAGNRDLDRHGEMSTAAEGIHRQLQVQRFSCPSASYVRNHCQQAALCCKCAA